MLLLLPTTILRGRQSPMFPSFLLCGVQKGREGEEEQYDLAKELPHLFAARDQSHKFSSARSPARPLLRCGAKGGKRREVKARRREREVSKAIKCQRQFTVLGRRLCRRLHRQRRRWRRLRRQQGRRVELRMKWIKEILPIFAPKRKGREGAEGQLWRGGGGERGMSSILSFQLLPF